MLLQIDPSSVLQGVLTFVAAIACTDAIKEVTAALKPRTIIQTAVLKSIIAIIILIIILFVAMNIQYINAHKGMNMHNSLNFIAEDFREESSMIQ